MDARELLLKGAEVIARDGWTQDGFYEVPESGADFEARDAAALKRAPVCAMGALYRAASGIADAIYGTLTYERCRTAETILLKSLYAGGEHWGSVPIWNDHPERTAEDVILAMKKAGSGE